MKPGRANVIWISLALALVLPIAIALVFEVWAGGKIPEIRKGEPHPSAATPSPVSAPHAETRRASEAQLLVVVATPASSTPTQAPPKSIWNTALPAPMAAAPVLRLDKHVVGTLATEAATREIMSSPAPDSTKAAALLDMLAQVPAEALGQTAEQAVRVLPDRNYAALAFPIITNPRTNGQVLSPMFADLMQRPDAVALPTLLQIAQTPDHPFAPSAHDNLSLLFGRDLGVDWPAWQQVVLQRVGTGGP